MGPNEFPVNDTKNRFEWQGNPPRGCASEKLDFQGLICAER
jgi:hypothetical protein